MASGTPIPPLSDKQKTDWNRFIDFMDSQGYKGNEQLDNRDTNLGRYLFQKFKTHTPGIAITYEDVPRVQQELQGYRNQLIQQYKAGKIQPDSTIKDPETEIMPGLSKVDGWLGSKTSSYKFPTARATNTDNTTTSYGTNVAAYDKDRNIGSK